jgi:hypothetical protein
MRLKLNKLAFCILQTYHERNIKTWQTVENGAK